MNSAELHRLADQKRAAAVDLVTDAGRLRRHAEELDGILDPLVGMSQRVWVGPAAQDFEDQVRSQAALLAGEASFLRASAAELDRRAGDLRREAAELRARALAAELAALVGQEAV